MSEQARREMLALPGEPFWLCDWTEVVFIHFEVAAEALQREVPFTLDRFEGRAFVSLVAFTLADMRPRMGGRLTRLLFKPFGTHRYLNVRTYVREGGHTGIYFLTEWLDAPWLNLVAGPALYGLPFRCGRLGYRNELLNGAVSGRACDSNGRLEYAGAVLDSSRGARPGSLNEFLVERYRAFTERGGKRGWFPVWHPPWKIARLAVTLNETSLLTATGRWFAHAQLHSAHGSAGAGGVWMGLRQSC